jgi:hypothetical protein
VPFSLQKRFTEVSTIDSAPITISEEFIPIETGLLEINNKFEKVVTNPTSKIVKKIDKKTTNLRLGDGLKVRKELKKQIPPNQLKDPIHCRS